MAVLKSWKIFYLVIIQLGQKYTKALLAGFMGGLLLSLLFWRIYPTIASYWFIPVTRIGVIGEYTPNSLPLDIQQQISTGLTTIDTNGTVLPGLATSWVATDSGKTFTFFLRNDKIWHNGKPVEAKDINYNIRNVTFTVKDARTLKATLNNAYSPFPSLLSKPLFQPGLRGFGEYRVSNIRLTGDKVSYLRLTPYAKTPVDNRSLEYRFYRTESAAVLAYKLGEVDELRDLTSAYDLASWGRTTVQEHTKYNRIITIFFNLSQQFLQDKNIRHALGFSLPEISGERAYSPISKTSWVYTDKVKKYTRDLTQAKTLYDPAVSSSDSARLVITTFSQYVDLAQDIADSWSSFGIPTNIKVVNTVPSDYQVLLSAWDVPPDPDQYPLWHSTQTQTNITQYSNVKIDKLLEDGRQELDSENRMKIYADFQRRLVDDAPSLFLTYAKSYTIKRR